MKVPGLADTEGPASESNCIGGITPGGEQLEEKFQALTKVEPGVNLHAFGTFAGKTQFGLTHVTGSAGEVGGCFHFSSILTHQNRRDSLAQSAPSGRGQAHPAD